VTGGQGSLGDMDAQTAARAGDEPNLLVSHASVFLWLGLEHRVIAVAMSKEPVATAREESL
jgi:hypothetical protein